MVNRVKKFKRWTGAINGAVDGALNVGEKAIKMGKMMGYKNGGKVKRTGVAKLHRGEIVLSNPQVKLLKKLLK